MGVYTGTEFRFGLEIDGLYAGRFMEVSGGGGSNGPMEYRESNMALE